VPSSRAPGAPFQAESRPGHSSEVAVWVARFSGRPRTGRRLEEAELPGERRVVRITRDGQAHPTRLRLALRRGWCRRARHARASGLALDRDRLDAARPRSALLRQARGPGRASVSADQEISCRPAAAPRPPARRVAKLGACRRKRVSSRCERRGARCKAPWRRRCGPIREPRQRRRSPRAAATRRAQRTCDPGPAISCICEPECCLTLHWRPLPQQVPCARPPPFLRQAPRSARDDRSRLGCRRAPRP